MGDPLSITSSIGAILQLTGMVVKYLNDVKDASRDRHTILVEISSINGLLFSLKDLACRAESGETWLATVRSLNVPDGPLERFKWALEQLAARLAPAAGLKNVAKALSWPFQKGEVTTILSTIERQKQLFILALQNDHMYVEHLSPHTIYCSLHSERSLGQSAVM
jgi:hypothetical protein